MNDFFLVIGIAFLILTVILLFSNDDDCNRLINALIIILQIVNIRANQEQIAMNTCLVAKRKRRMLR